MHTLKRIQRIHMLECSACLESGGGGGGRGRLKRKAQITKKYGSRILGANLSLNIKRRIEAACGSSDGQEVNVTNTHIQVSITTT